MVMGAPGPFRFCFQETPQAVLINRLTLRVQEHKIMVFGPENPVIWVLGPLGLAMARESRSRGKKVPV